MSALSDLKDENPVIVAGQAVNLWASVYLPKEESALLGSVDMDILATPRVVRWMSEIPGWKFTPNVNEIPVIKGRIEKETPDGRLLRIEALSHVFGLDDKDLKAVVELQFREHRFLTLDPVALLKAKCANANELPQGEGGRHDESHLEILGRCVPAYLREVAGNLAAGNLREETALSTLRRLFDVLRVPSYGGVLRHMDLTPDMLVPGEFATSSNPAIRELYLAQMPAAREACNVVNYAPNFRPKKSYVPVLGQPGRIRKRTMRNYW